jgi:hypothetical protein
MDAVSPRVLIRLVRSPLADRGELLVVHVDTRTISNPEVLVYSVTRSEWRVEHHRHLMWRTKRANLSQRADAADALSQMGIAVRILQAAPRAIPGFDDPDESPVLKRRRLPKGYITCKR